jgi:cytochrome P450 family 6
MIFITLVLILVLFSIALIYLHFIQHRYWQRLNFPFEKPEFFYGNARGIGTKFVHADFWKKFYMKMKSRGPVCGVYLFYEPFAIITNLDLVKTILVKDFHNFPNRGLYYNPKDDPASANLFNLEDETWMKLRQKLTPAFTSGKLKLMVSIISQISDQLINVMRTSSNADGVIEVREILSRFSTDVIGQVAFGIDCNSLANRDEEFYQMGLKAAKKFTFLKRILTANYPKLARKFHITTIDDDASQFYRRVIHDVIEYRKENKIKRNDFMSLLMENDSLSFNEIWAQSVIFFLAGFETTATKLTFCLYELGRHKNVQCMARENVKTAFHKFDGKLSYEAVQQMDYLEQCIKGTFELIFYYKIIKISIF